MMPCDDIIIVFILLFFFDAHENDAHGDAERKEARTRKSDERRDERREIKMRSDDPKKMRDERDARRNERGKRYEHPKHYYYCRKICATMRDDNAMMRQNHITLYYYEPMSDISILLAETR
jgi:hypothetical protein